MRRATLLFLACLAGCDEGQSSAEQPDKAIVNRIELELGALKCPGSLGVWERHYWYSRDRSGSINRSTVEIDLRQAGFEEFGYGRHIHPAPPVFRFDTDDRDYRVAFGTFDIPTGALKMSACGSNMS